MNATCPNCRTSVSVGEGQSQAHCPHCSNDFKVTELMPSRPTTVGFSSSPEPIHLHVSAAPTYPAQPRLESGGWFARSFMSTTGILLALGLFFVAGPVLICGGCLVLGAIGTSAQIAEEQAQRQAAAQAQREVELETETQTAEEQAIAMKNDEADREQREVQRSQRIKEERAAMMRTWTRTDGATFRGIYQRLRDGVYSFDTDEGPLTVPSKELSNKDRTWIIEYTHRNKSR